MIWFLWWLAIFGLNISVPSVTHSNNSAPVIHQIVVPKATPKPLTMEEIGLPEPPPGTDPQVDPYYINDPCITGDFSALPGFTYEVVCK